MPDPMPRQPQRLMRSVLGPVDIAASTMANIAPAMSFYFGFGFLALTAGIASPLTIIAAGVAIAFLSNTLAQFSRAHPSTGSFITFIGKAFGPTISIVGFAIAFLVVAFGMKFFHHLSFYVVGIIIGGVVILNLVLTFASKALPRLTAFVRRS
jgi:amino acid transporter